LRVNIPSSQDLRVLGHHGLDGRGDAMQVVRNGDVLYVGHTGTSGAGTSILDVADPANPKLVTQWDAPAKTHTHKVQVADGLLLVNHELFPYKSTPTGEHSAGLAVYELSDPLRPRQIGFWSSGGRGVHRIVYTGGRYAHVSAIPEGFRDRIWVVIDLSDPTNPVEATRWWVPGQHVDEEPVVVQSDHAHHRVAAHHALVADNVAYLGYDDSNLIVLDVSDITKPRKIGECVWGGGATHTCLPLPGRNLLVVTDEQQTDGPGAPERLIHLVDIENPAEPRYLRPLPAPDAAYDTLPRRFGPHNLHENQAGAFSSERLVFASYFSAGVRVYDLADRDDPREIAHWVPEGTVPDQTIQINDLFVDSDKLIWATERHESGVYVLEAEGNLAQLMNEEIS
jgi:hypothetical protein